MHLSEASALVFRPVGEVWNFIANAENIPLWSPGVVEAKQVSDEPFGVGTEITGWSMFLLTRIPWVGVMTAVERPHRTLFESTESRFKIIAETLLDEAPEGTRITARVQYELGMGKVFEHLSDAIVSRAYTRALQTAMYDLADVLDRARRRELTRRQKDVLNLLQRGLTDQQIAAELSISTKTAGHHVSAILAALDVPSRRHLWRQPL